VLIGDQGPVVKTEHDREPGQATRHEAVTECPTRNGNGEAYVRETVEPPLEGDLCLQPGQRWRAEAVVGPITKSGADGAAP
jgi:hypothetical protein